MKKIAGKIIAMVLAVCVAFQFQVPTFAANEGTKYVSELIVSYGEGDAAEADAKSWLKDNGYEIIDTNLNAGAESGASASYASWITAARSARAVYIGYKTTTDKDQAITSIKTMNMTGNYSYADYQEVIEQLEGDVQDFMDKLGYTLSEWRENYKAGRGKAVEAYYLLQMMYCPDNNNMRMGDLLLNETKEEMGDAAYEKLSDEEKLQHADMTTILLQGNSDSMKYIEQILAMGADTDTEKTWIDRLTAMGSYDDMLDALEQEAGEKGETFLPSVAEGMLHGMYEDVALNLAAGITYLQTLFKEYLESGTTLQDDKDQVSTFINKKNDAWSNQEWLSIGLLYESLSQYKYPSEDNPDRTLQEFFMEDFDTDSTESIEKLFPMAAALSDGQRTASAFITVSQLISQGITTDEEAMKAAESFKGYIDDNDPVSVFAGVDRSVFDSSSTALTSSARELQNSTEKPWTSELFGTPFSLRTVVGAAVFTVSLFAAVGCSVAMKSCGVAAYTVDAFNELQDRVANELALSFEGTEEEFDEAVAQKATEMLIEADNGGNSAAVELVDGLQEANDYVVNSGVAESKSLLFRGFQIATAVLVIVTIAAGVWTVVSGISDLQSYYDKNMDLYPIPDNMVDEAKSESGELIYTYYKAVQSNRVEKGYTKEREVLKDNADLNGDLGKEWLALYYTKDANAGDPITVSSVSGFKTIKGSEATPSGMKALTLFGSDSPVNLTDSDWVWNDVNGGLYLYYSTDSISAAASVFATPYVWIIYAGLGIVIAIAFFIVGAEIGKRRKIKEA